MVLSEAPEHKHFTRQEALDFYADGTEKLMQHSLNEIFVWRLVKLGEEAALAVMPFITEDNMRQRLEMAMASTFYPEKLVPSEIRDGW